jgi:hypothetical protein
MHKFVWSFVGCGQYQDTDRHWLTQHSEFYSIFTEVKNIFVFKINKHEEDKGKWRMCKQVRVFA